MADIAAGNVTYSFTPTASNPQLGVKTVESFKVNTMSVVFGNGTLTYPSGGIPLTKGSMGCGTFVQSLKIIDGASANGFVYKVVPQSNSTDPKIRIYQGDNANVASAPLIELVAGTAAPAAATLILEAQGW